MTPKELRDIVLENNLKSYNCSSEPLENGISIICETYEYNGQEYEVEYHSDGFGYNSWRDGSLAYIEIL